MAENRFSKYVTPQRGGFIPDPNAAAEQERKAAEERRRQQDQEMERQRLAIAQQQAALQAQLQGLQTPKIQAEAQQAQTDLATNEKMIGAKAVRQRLRTGNILDAIQATRNIARRGGTGVGSILSALPSTDARELKNALSPIVSSLAFERLQEMRDESKTGGALGSVSERELDLLAGAVAGLDTGVSRETFLQNLDAVERHFVGSQMALGGVDPSSDEGQALLKEYVRPGGSASGNSFTPEQQRMVDAFYQANPNFTADQLRAFTQSIGAPEIANVDEIIAARDEGRGVAPAALATEVPAGQGRITQGMSGVNEGIAGALGLPIDALTGGINAVGSGMNWLNEAVGGDPRANLPRIDNPVGGGQWFRENVLAPTIGEAPNTSEGQFWRRAGQSVGAAAVPGGIARTPGAVASALMSGAGGGIGAATMQEQFPGNQAAEMGGEVLGALLGGGPAAAISTNMARNEARAAVPTVDQLKAHAGSLYDQAEARGIVAGPEVTTALADTMSEIARREALLSAKGRVSEQYTKIGPVLQTLQDEAGQLVTPKRIQVLRETLADAAYSAEGKEQRIATQMLRAFDDMTVPLAPELADARDVASRYLQAGPIDKAILSAGTREGQFSQSGLDNTLRNEFANLERKNINNTLNFNDPTLEAIQQVVRPSGARAAGRWVGRLAPTGVVSGAPGGAIGLGAMYAGEPVLGALLTGGIYGAGAGGRALASRLASQEAQDASLMARSGGTMALPDMLDMPASDAVAAALAAQGTVALTDEDAMRDAEIARLLSQAQFR